MLFAFFKRQKRVGKDISSKRTSLTYTAPIPANVVGDKRKMQKANEYTNELLFSDKYDRHLIP